MTKLSDDELEVVAGGLKSSSGKWIVTESYSCMYYMRKDGISDRYAGTRQCRFCRHQEREFGVIMVCGNPSNT